MIYVRLAIFWIVCGVIIRIAMKIVAMREDRRRGSPEYEKRRAEYNHQRAKQVVQDLGLFIILILSLSSLMATGGAFLSALIGFTFYPMEAELLIYSAICFLIALPIYLWTERLQKALNYSADGPATSTE